MPGRTWISLLLLAAAPAVHAQGPSAADGPYPLEMHVGDSIAVCATGTVVCPVVAPTCDDPSVVAGVDSDQGLAFKGLKPGTTLCSVHASSGSGARRLYRITVQP